MVSADENGGKGSNFFARIVLPEGVHGAVLSWHVEALQILLIPHSLIKQQKLRFWVLGIGSIFYV